MKTPSTLFAALLLSAALALPATADPGEGKDKKKNEQARQEEQSQAAEARAAERGKPTEAEQQADQDDREPGPAAPAEPLTDNEDPSDDWSEWWNFHQGQFDTGAFDGMDQDDNQTVSREEWSGGFALFDRLDRDHDGVITQAEYENRELRGLTREALFGRLDVNGNTRLEPSEWWWSRDAFALVDRDSNGWVSPDEFLRLGEPRPR
ncbi:MAG TPA: hypothetical protein VN493_27255 [Thermoanaerobaculia bacterium]|nr:hypothetical protein [Thermoanaerobaculia bacterium]